MSSNPLLFKYPLDETGINPTNLVVNEPHDIGHAQQRAFVANHGPFYNKGFIVRDSVTGNVLVPREQYLLVQPYQEACIRTGLEVSSVIWITDATVSNEITITYQVVGGEFSWSAYALKQMVEDLEIDNRPVQWGDIIGTPVLFPPTPHLHDLGDTYGWEYISRKLEDVYRAILLGDEASHDELRQQFMYYDQQLQLLIDALRQSVEDHAADTNNPHNTTKTQVGLGSVQNYGIATLTEAQAGTVNNKYMTPYLVAQAASAIVTAAVSAHANRVDNPHGVTKAQVGLGSVENYGLATKTEAEAGSISNKYMTPLRVKEAIMALAGAALSSHLANVNNPHSVTKSQVGLGSVENYGVATTAEAQAGTINTKYMTPIRVKEAITLQAVTPLNTHINRVDNPHGTTKTHVGLGSVDNFATATQAEAQAGVLNTRFMTPLRTKEAIMQLAGDAITSHTTNYSNPHQVTKAQVGLESVENYAVATTAEAQAGTVNNKYMTPLRVKEAINFIADALVTAHSSLRNNPHQVTAAQLGVYTTAQTDDVAQRYSVGVSWHVHGRGNHTRTLPSWVKRFRIVAVGGGGGGARGYNGGRGGGGGAGAHYEFFGDTTLTGHTLSFTVGRGGNGGSGSGAPSVSGENGTATILFGGNVVVGAGQGGIGTAYADINPGGGGGNCSVSGEPWSLAFIGAGGDGSDGGSAAAHWGGSGDGGASFFGGGSRGSVQGLFDPSPFPAGSGGGGSTVAGAPGMDGVVIIYY